MDSGLSKFLKSDNANAEPKKEVGMELFKAHLERKASSGPLEVFFL